MRTALAKGMSRRRAILVHGLRNGIIPLATLIGLTLPYLLSGALVVEIVFGWPGVGLFAYQRALDFDYTSVLGATTLAAFLVVMGNLLADVLYAVPRPEGRGRDARRARLMSRRPERGGLRGRRRRPADGARLLARVRRAGSCRTGWRSRARR